MIYQFIWEVEVEGDDLVEQKYLFNFYEISFIDYNILTTREPNSSPPPDFIENNKEYTIEINFTSNNKQKFVSISNDNNKTEIQNLYSAFNSFTP